MRIEGINKALQIMFDSNYVIGEYLEYNRCTKALLAIEERYGPFYVYFNDATFKKKDLAARELLFNRNICELGHDNLIFYNKTTHKETAGNNVCGVNLEDMAAKYINKCLHYDTLVRYKNGDGEGYATNNIREIIMTTGVPIECTKFRII